VIRGKRNSDSGGVPEAAREPRPAYSVSSVLTYNKLFSGVSAVLSNRGRQTSGRHKMVARTNPRLTQHQETGDAVARCSLVIRVGLTTVNMRRLVVQRGLDPKCGRRQQVVVVAGKELPTVQKEMKKCCEGPGP